MLKANGTFITSSFCAADKPQCVEVRAITKRTMLGHKTVAVEMRDSKLGSASPVVSFNKREWRKFLKNAPWVTSAADGQFRIEDLAFTPDEWIAFLEGVKVHEFDIPSPRLALA